jgi:Restriction endonuclease
MAKKGIEFELFVKAIYEEILVFDGCDTIKVEHDVSIKGKSKQQHQIDVYWEFKLAGITHRVAVECKEYTNTVSVGKVRDFYGALEDIGNIQGVFVTTKGYQSGAITYAKHKDISLKVVKKPTKEDIDSYQGIKTIFINANLFCITNVTVTPILDVEWVLQNTSFKEGDEFSLNAKSNDIKVMDSNLNLLGTFHDFENQLPREPENTKNLIHKYDFNDGFIHILNSKYPPLKLKGIQFKYDTYTICNESMISYKLMAEAILKDIVTGDAHLYNKRAETEITRN